MTIDQIERFRQLGSKTAGHPEYGFASGIETTTGPLGQGLANSVGMALAERVMNAQFGDDLVDHHTYVIAGDGCLMEGISQEAIALAGHLKLNKLIVFWDNNSISIDGPVSLSDSTDQVARVKASGWNAFHIDGHDPEAIAAAIEAARKSDKPTLIAAKTTIGFGAPTKAGTKAAHGSPLGKEEIAATRKALNWDSPPFVIPDDILSAWREAGTRGAAPRADWEKRFAASGDRRAEFERRMAGKLPANFNDTIAAYKQKLAADKPKVATRKSSEMALEVINGALAETIGGSADLTPSNNTKTSQTKELSAGNYANRYVHYGIREHAMAAAINGIALHGGLIPYGGTFFCFTDYARPAMRLASLMGIRSLFVMTHDSIGLGEDGPTHQPVEHLAAMRAIPNHLVFRPADSTETAECWQAAIHSTKAPSTLVLTRQNLRAVRTEYVAENLSAKGAYELAAAEGGDGEGRDLRQRLRGRDRARRTRHPAEERHADARRLGALLRALRGAGQGLSREGARQGAGEDRGRGRAPSRLGPLRRLRRRFRRHDRLRRQRTREGPLQIFRHHRRGRCQIAGERVKNGVPKGEDARAIPESEPARPHP